MAKKSKQFERKIHETKWFFDNNELKDVGEVQVMLLCIVLLVKGFPFQFHLLELTIGVKVVGSNTIDNRGDTIQVCFVP